MLKAIRIFGRIKDPREEWKIKHKLVDCIILTLAGVICGAEMWEEIEEFGHARYDQLQAYLDLPNGVPSHDTIRRVMGMIEPKQLNRCYQEWISAIIPGSGGDIIAIDGKTVCGSGSRGKGIKPIHMVSAWSKRAGVTLAQIKTNEKSNEITAIPELLDILSLAGSVVTIDAMGCQTAIAEKIADKKADYVLACKENQPLLYQEIVEYFKFADESDYLEIAHDTTSTKEKSRNRIEKRTYDVIYDCDMLSRLHDFPEAKTIGRVRSRIIHCADGRVTEDTRYYITSAGNEKGVELFAKAVRSHWGIENSCHWVLDATFGEDANGTRDLIASENLTVARKLALALSKKVPDSIVEKYSRKQAKYTSMKYRLFLASLYPNFMLQILLAGA